MDIIENKTFDEERALYGLRHVLVRSCSFTGPADGESALKEGEDITAEHCLCDLRYPFWHVHGLAIRDCDITENGRAALWYSDHIDIEDSKLHGIKALRECHEVSVRNCDVISNEFGWFSRFFRMRDCTVKSDYFMLHAADLDFADVRFTGKYALQYLHDCTFEHCDITSRDAFWHAVNVTVRDCVPSHAGALPHHKFAAFVLLHEPEARGLRGRGLRPLLREVRRGRRAHRTRGQHQESSFRTHRAPAVDELIQDGDSHAEIVITAGADRNASA